MIILPWTLLGATTIQAVKGKDHGTLTRVHSMMKWAPTID